MSKIQKNYITGYAANMKTAKHFAEASRADAKEMTRQEKMDMIYLVNAASIFSEMPEKLADRLKMIDGGTELATEIMEKSLRLVAELRATIPERQRTNLYNMGLDMRMSMVPKYSPESKVSVIPNEDFRELTEASREKCRECILDNEDAQKECRLYNLFTAILPLNRYDTFLCPYNLAEWGNPGDE